MSLDSHRTFNPRNHPVDLVSAFTKFQRKYGYIYDGENRTPPSSITDDNAIAEWREKDKAKLFLSRAVSDEFLDDYEDAVPEIERAGIKFSVLVQKMKARYTPTSNKVHNHFLFHRLKQRDNEKFDDFTHRVRGDAELCEFTCSNAECTVKDILIRDQILVGTNNEAIRDEALKRQWGLTELLQQGRLTESSLIAASEIKIEEHGGDYEINRAKAGPYSSKQAKSNIHARGDEVQSCSKSRKGNTSPKKSKFLCFKCEDPKCAGFNKCKYYQKKCRTCKMSGHGPKSRLCRANKKANEKHEKETRKKKTNRTQRLPTDSSSNTEDTESDSSTSGEEVCAISAEKIKILRVSVDKSKLLRKCNRATVKGGRRHKPKKCSSKKDFHASVVINGAPVVALVDTGADVNVMSKKEARLIGIKWKKCKIKLRPYGSKPIKVCGMYTGMVKFDENIVEADIFIVRNSLETLLSGITAEELGIVSFHGVNVVHQDDDDDNDDDDEEEEPVEENYPETDNPRIQEILLKRSKRFFNRIGKCKSKKIILHAKDDPRCAAGHIQPERSLPFHLRKKFDATVDKLIQEGVFEEHEGPAEYISNPVLVPNDDKLRVTVDYRNVNKHLLNTHCPIPKVDDLRATMNGCKYFSKLDLRQAFFQFELTEESKKYTVFYASGRFLRNNRLSQGLLPASSELNKVLKQLLGHIPELHMIHDDILIATKTEEEQYAVLDTVLELLEEEGLTLNGDKCIFVSQDIPFWGMRFTKDGIKPDPKKCKALQEMDPPSRKEDVPSFISMLSAHSRFIPMFSQLTENIRALQKKKSKFKWTEVHQKEFDAIKEYFKESTTLSFFDPDLPTWIFVDASYAGLGAVLAQGQDIDNTNIIAFASRATTSIERRYPQIDLEAIGVDFGLRRFREYCVGADNINVVTDHRPLKAVFENKRLGSIRIDRTKLRHQDINYNIIWRKGKLNPADYLSRHPRKVTQKYEKEAAEDAKLLYSLHNNEFVMKDITIDRIQEETMKDKLLQAVMHHIHINVEPTAPELSYFKNIFHELTVSATGLVLRQHRIVLPQSLQAYAVCKAHSMGHFGCSGIKRQLRNHFDFPHLDSAVEGEVAVCEDCQLFTRKAVKAPLTPVYVPSQAWEYVSIDFFGPMPDESHVLVVQDLCTKYPVAALLKKGTSARETIDAIDRIFTNFGRPCRYRSDNGPPFSSREFCSYMESCGIVKDLSYAYRPQSNPVETWMKPLGKCLKIANRNHRDKETAIRELLLAYRTTPHPATGLSPGEMLFRHGYRGAYPNRKTCTNSEFDNAVEKMKNDKIDRCDKINSSVKRKEHTFEVGQWVLTSRKKRRKFDPLFHEEPWMIEALTKTGATIHNPQRTKRKTVHVDDIKPYITQASDTNPISTFTLPKTVQEENTVPGEDTEQSAVVHEEEVVEGDQRRRSTRQKISTKDTRYHDFICT